MTKGLTKVAGYAELHCHSNFSFHDGASSIDELAAQAVGLGYRALALTDHDNLCGALAFAQACRSLDLKAITGAELTLKGDGHLTLLSETQAGYRHLCRLITAAHIMSPRRHPELAPDILAEHAGGLILLTGCPQGPIPTLLVADRYDEAAALAKQYMDWFGPSQVFLELQQNLAYGDTKRNRRLVQLAQDLGLGVAATGNVHYHVRERHQLQDALVSIKHRKTLEESHRERRPNSEYYLRPPDQVAALFRECPRAIVNTLAIAERCSFDLAQDLGYRLPDYPVPAGYTAQSYLEKLCREAAVRRYGSLTPKVRARLEEELRLIERRGLVGFLLLYHDIVQLGRDVMVDLGLNDKETPLEENPPGRGRGSSVALLVGYLIGLSHIDPLHYNLSLERFLPEDAEGVPDIDLDFPRNIREELIKRVHAKYGWQRAALTGMLDTYKLKGAVRDLGLALGLPSDQVDRLAKRVEHHSARDLPGEMRALPDFADKVEAPVWRDLVRLAGELDGFPKYLAQHPGGMIISSSPLIDMVPVQKGGMEGRYICQWDKDSIDDAGFVKIDFLALGALSQMQEAVRLIEERTGHTVDLSRIDFEDKAVYDMLGRADTIGIFQVESAAQIQTITRIRPRNLTDMAHEVGAVRPGVGVNRGVSLYIARRTGRQPVAYDHPLERRALERTLGVILFQDQVNQVARDVGSLSPAEADRLRRAFGRRHNQGLIKAFWEQFREGAARRGVNEETAQRIFAKFNGQYMFPESHAFAFGVTAYQAAWLKHYYPLEFYVGLFNQQPMGFYNLETLKEDAKRHGIAVLNPDLNRSGEKCTMEGGVLRLGLLQVAGVGEVAARAMMAERERGGHYQSLEDFMVRAGLLQEAVESLIEAGAADSLAPGRRDARWEAGLRYRPPSPQLALPLPVEQDMAELPSLTDWDEMAGEYRALGLFPRGHVMEKLRPLLGKDVVPSHRVPQLKDRAVVRVAGLVVRRQRPLAKAYFITLEDEFGHIPLVVWPQVYQRLRARLREPFLVVRGTVSRREGVLQVVVQSVETLKGLQKAPQAKNWC